MTSYDTCYSKLSASARHSNMYLSLCFSTNGNRGCHLTKAGILCPYVSDDKNARKQGKSFSEALCLSPFSATPDDAFDDSLWGSLICVHCSRHYCWLLQFFLMRLTRSRVACHWQLSALFSAFGCLQCSLSLLHIRQQNVISHN